MAGSLRIDSLNCKGLGNRHKRRSILEHFHKVGSDLVLLQETHTTLATSKLYGREWKRMAPRGHRSMWNSYTNRSCGVAILIADATTTSVVDYQTDPNGRVITLKFKTNGHTYQVQCVYAPTVPETRPQFFQNLNGFLYPDAATITAGDFNMVENPARDRCGGTVTVAHTRGLTELQALKYQEGLVDVWRERHPSLNIFTWSAPNNLVHSRLDRFYLEKTLREDFLTQVHTHNPWSDHRIVTLTLQVKTKDAARGGGYWKLNTSLLDDTEYTETITELITAWKQRREDYDDIQSWWRDLKIRVKLISVELSVRRNRERREQLAALQKMVDRENTAADPNRQYITDTLEQIADLKEHKHRGSMVRSREKMIIDGEKPTRYFYAQERIKKVKSTITKLTAIRTGTGVGTGPGDTVTETPDILNEIHTYYTKLFKKQTLDIGLQDELLQNVTKRLPRDQMMSMEAPISDGELENALRHANRDRSPGLDGLPVEFYDGFWGHLKESFRELANDVFTQHIARGSQQRISLITLLHKRDDKGDLDNWRPISLLCVDYKIISKVLSMRLKIVLPHIIEEDQTCGILGRTIFENLYIVRDTIDYTRDHGIPAYLVSLDFQKAFDSVDHDFLEKTLKTFGFGPVYTSFIMSTLRDSLALAMNGGCFTAGIELGRGLKQGDQESMQLYDLIGEVLAIQVRKNDNIRGIRLPSRVDELKLSIYADDNNNFSTTQQSIVHLFKELDRFRQATGCTINKKKTQGLLLGGAPVPSIDIPIVWNPPGGVKILGVRFFADAAMTQSTTWNEIVEKIRNRAELMAPRRLSMRGRAILANSMLLAKAWHVATVVPPRSVDILAINKTIFDYIYDYKQPHAISQDELTLRLPQGGIGLLDLKLQQQALRINRLRHILDHTQTATWLIIPRLYTTYSIMRHNTEWPFLRALPHIDHSDPFTQSITTPTYLREIVNFLHEHKEAFLRMKDISTHNIYMLLLRHKRTTITITSEKHWKKALGRDLNWKRIWGTTYQSLYTSHHLDTWYKFLHNALATGEKTSKAKGRYALNCSSCNQYETTLHTFFECTYAETVWNRYYDIYIQLLSRPHLHYTHVLFPTILPKDKHKARLVLTITGMIVHELWRARCAAKHDHIPTNADTSTAYINARLKRLHFAYLHTQPDYEKHLCLPSPICTAHNDTLQFTLPQFDASIQDSDTDSDVASDSSTT